MDVDGIKDRVGDGLKTGFEPKTTTIIGNTNFKIYLGVAAP